MINSLDIVWFVAGILAGYFGYYWILDTKKINAAEKQLEADFDRVAEKIDAAAWQAARCELAAIYLKLTEHGPSRAPDSDEWTLADAIEWLDDRSDLMDAEMTKVINE